MLENVASACLTPALETPWAPFFRPAHVLKAVRKAKARAGHYLNEVGLHAERNKIAAELSYGQQKLLAIARLLAVADLPSPSPGLVT